MEGIKMILIDTNIYVAYLNKRDQNHSQAKKQIRKLLIGEYGSRFSISEVFSETATLLYRQTKKKSLVDKAWNLFYHPNYAWGVTYVVTRELIAEAKSIFDKYTTNSRPLSFVDCLLIATAFSKNINLILSFDDKFDGIIGLII